MTPAAGAFSAALILALLAVVAHLLSGVELIP